MGFSLKNVDVGNSTGHSRLKEVLRFSWWWIWWSFDRRKCKFGVKSFL
jgi:hypothetical protein